MQKNEIKAFRERLRRAGFKDISIYDYCYGKYSVSCTCPDGTRISKLMSIEKIINTPRLVWFD